MKKVAVFTIKGGVGKTVTITLLGIYFALRGKKVLLVDTDLQTSLSSSLLGAKHYSFSVNSGQHGLGAAALSPNAKPQPVNIAPNLDLIPMEEDALEYVRNDMVAAKLADLPEEGYDMVLIDTYPSYDKGVAQLLLQNVDFYYVVVTPAIQSYRTVKIEVSKLLPRLLEPMKRPPKMIGILPNNSTLTRSKTTQGWITELNSLCYNTNIPKYIPCVFQNEIAHSEKILNYERIQIDLISGNTRGLATRLGKLNIPAVADEFMKRYTELLGVAHYEQVA